MLVTTSYGGRTDDGRNGDALYHIHNEDGVWLRKGDADSIQGWMLANCNMITETMGELKNENNQSN